MKSLLAIGTSHTTDKHASSSDSESYSFYPNLENGDQRWIEYLAEELDVKLIDMSVGGYGINTYFLRLLSVLKDTTPDIALIEMPSIRMEVYIDKNQNPLKTLITDYWKLQGNIQNDLYCYTAGDSQSSLNDIKISNKFSLINDGAEIPFTVSELDTLHKLVGKYSNDLLYTQQFAQMVAIDNWLKQLKIKTYWWSWNFPTYMYQDIDCLKDFNLITPDKIEASDRLSQFMTYVNEILGYNKQNKEHFYDGVHLNSNIWKKQLVDKHFVPYLREKINWQIEN